MLKQPTKTAPRRKSHEAKLPETLAAVDLGSNSFHMIIARLAGGQLHTLDRLREMVQLGAGLNKKNCLTQTVQLRALACLRRFGQRLRGMPPGSVRVVGTNALRQAKNARPFLRAAQRALGYPIEIIGGGEEARLIYLGVARTVPHDGKQRLVIDIGGGSTEFIIGKGLEAQHVESVELGCVSGSRRHFPNGSITRTTLQRAEIAARQELQTLAAQYRSIGWEICIGASGTINAIHDVVRANGWSDQGITYDSLRKLRKRLLSLGHVSKLKLAGLRSERAAVFPGGVAILFAIFESLGLEHMTVSDGALREGLLYDLLGRIRHKDIREHTVAALCARYHVDSKQAARVAHTASALLTQTADAWKLTEYANLLGWAAQLHELGLAVSHQSYHRHSAYLVANSEMPGFSRQDQQLLTALMLSQRSKPAPILFKELPDGLAKITQRLSVLLRTAVLLHRSRSEQASPKLKLIATPKILQVKFPRGWLNKHPLTQADLAQESRYLKAMQIQLRVS